MKNFLLPALLLASLTVHAQDLPKPSPFGKVEQVVGLTNISVEYSRPSMKGREIFGGLVPYDQVWRTGANLNTIIELSGPVKIEGKDLAAGKYSLYTIPGKESWEVIFNKNLEAHGEGDRKDEEDVLRVKVPSATGDNFETLTFLFDNVKDDKAELQLRWATTLVKINLHADAKDMSLANIKTALAKPDADFRVYHNSARYLIDRNMMPKEALQYAQKSTEMEKTFWNVHTLALAHAANGQYKEAITAAEESKKLSVEAKYDAYVKINDEKIAEWQRSSPAGKTPTQGTAAPAPNK